MTPIRIVLVDDHQLVRSGLRKLLESVDDFCVVGEGSSAIEGVELARTLRPDIILMDWSMPGGTGLEATEQIRREKIDTKVIMVSMFDSAGFCKQAELAGANGYVVKGGSPEDLERVIREVSETTQFIDDPETHRADVPTVPTTQQSPLDDLTGRQVEVLRLLALGRSSREIAGFLFISEKTVEHHRSNLRRVLGLNDTAKLTLFAVKHGIISPAELDNIDLSDEPSS